MGQHPDERIDTIGLVGLGMMGQGIASCLIAYGLRVIAYSRTAAREQETRTHIGGSLQQLVQRDVIPASNVTGWEPRFRYVGSLSQLKDCPFIVETVGEEIELKQDIYGTLEAAVAEDAIIATNTSSLPISMLQDRCTHPDRFIGMHWAEPAEITRYLEVVRGARTADRAVALTRQVGERCGKEPTVLNFDIRGFISNRLMYAMMREAVHLVEIGVADVATVDRSFRNDIGWWATICGPFRWMDLTGLPLYAQVMEGLFPELCNTAALPKLMKQKVDTGTRFYEYPGDTQQEWDKAWVEFTHDIRTLVDKYAKRVKL